MTHLWLVPVDESSFQETIAKPIDLSDQEDKPGKFPDYTRVWGVRTDPEQGEWKRNRKNLERMETGDPLLIYRISTNQYHAKGRVGPFWLDTTYVRDQYRDGGPAIKIFAVEEYDETDMDPEVVNDILGYKDNFRPQGLWRVSDDRPTDQVVRRFDI